METFCKIGDKIGYLGKYIPNGETELKWELRETQVTKLGICKDGVHVYTKRFSPLYDEDIRIATKMMERDGVIIAREHFVMDEKLKDKAQRWVEWVNESPENEKKASPFYEDE